MNVLVLDVENSVQWVETIDEETTKIKTVIDNSPFNPKNRLVNVHWRKIINDTIGNDEHSIFYHNDHPIPDSRENLQQALDWADVLVGHNIKYDYLWLKEAGFSLPDKVFDTMIAEYILARGVITPLSLAESAIRRNVSHKKSELIEEYFDNKIGFEQIPLDIVLEYTDADVLSTAELYLEQVKLYQLEENLTLNNIVTLMNEMCLFLVEIEHNGIKIDLNQLDIVEKQYLEEQEQIIKSLNTIVADVMGDTPINLNSGKDISMVVYSREVVNRALHLKLFHIGEKFIPFMEPSRFTSCVRKTTKVIHKTHANHCLNCNGKGKKQRYTGKGEPYKLLNVCPICKGRGYTLANTNQVAGLKLSPEIPLDASAHGFAVSKIQVDRLIAQAQTKGNLQAVEFLTKKKRLNAINTYLNSFVEGIRRWTRADGILHPNFNQTVARTGRLSSSNPNFQNQPKGRTFPVRDCIVSRFKDVSVMYYDSPADDTGYVEYENGSIIECDFSGLEFRVAGDLSRDSQIIGDVLSGKDIHRQTATITLEKEDIDKNERNEAKPDTFAPLYGATGKNKPAHIRRYYEEFFNIYKRHKQWQIEQMESVIANGYVRTPSGREYMFPGTKRIKGGVTNATQIVNYPVQGFATGDIVPLACIRAHRKWIELKPKSVLILTVHDSLEADCYPGEERLVYDILHWATTGVTDEIKTRWNYEMALPLASEISYGKDWGHLEELKYEL